MITIVHRMGMSYAVQDLKGRLSALEIHYALGYFPPQYPVPAIRQGYEFQYELHPNKGEVHLVHWSQGVYGG